MSILSRIRDNIGLVAVIIFIALLAFILTDFISGVTAIFGGPPSVGTVAGEDIDAQEFSTRYTNALNNMGEQGTDEMRYQVMDQVWEQMVGEALFKRQYESLGLEISGEEVYGMFTNDPVHPVVRQYFMQPNEPFDANEMKRRLEQIANDPELRPQLQEFEKYLLESRAQEQFQYLVQMGYTGSKAAAKARYLEQNKKVTFNWVGVPFSSLADSTIKVTDSELKSYISRNAARYKQKEDEVVLKYSVFPVTPSAADSARAREAILKSKAAFASTTEDSLFISARSRTPFNNTAQAIGAFAPGIADSLRAATKGQLFGPVLEGEYYKVYKVIDVQAGKSSAKVNHILFTYRDDSAAALTRANDIKGQINAGNFSILATANSEDFQSRGNGGSLGWIDLDIYGENFKNAVNAASPGSIIGPVKGLGGYHIIQVLEKSTTGYVVGEIEQEIYYSTETDKGVYRDANQFAAKAQAAKNLENAANELGISALTSNPLSPNAKMISGLANARELVLWAVKANVGDFSPVMQSQDAYVVAQVYSRRNEGLRDIEDVRDEVTLRVINEKKAKIIADKLAAIKGADLAAYHSGYGAGATQGTAPGVSFESASVAGLGSEYAVIGTAYALEKGKISEPIKGTNGIYLIQVTEITDAPEADEATLTNLQNIDRSTGSNSFRTYVLDALKEIGKVKDLRYRAGF